MRTIIFLIAFFCIFSCKESLQVQRRLKFTSIHRISSFENIPEVDSVQSLATESKRETTTFFSGLFSIGSLLLTYTSAEASNYNENIKNIPILYDGITYRLEEYLGSKCSLIINVASQCALTNQYEELVDLYNKYHSAGFNILAFPCNQFGSQEPAPVSRIRKDMADQFGVQFPIFDKIDVNGPSASPLYVRLKSYSDIGVSNISKISWNFEKFIIGPDGIPLRRYKPGIRPIELTADIEAIVKKGIIPIRKRATLNDF